MLCQIWRMRTWLVCGSENFALGLFPGFVGFCFLCRNGSVSEEQRFHPGHGLRGEGNRGRPAGFARLVEGRPCGPTFCEQVHEGYVILYRNDFAGAITALAVVQAAERPRDQGTCDGGAVGGGPAAA